MLITSKQINAAQLSVELGRVALRVTGPLPDGTWRVGSPDVDDKALQAALDAHTANPQWTDPNPPAAPAPTDDERARAQVDQIRDKAKQVLAGTGTFTPAELQKIVAANALRSGR